MSFYFLIATVIPKRQPGKTKNCVILFRSFVFVFLLSLTHPLKFTIFKWISLQLSFETHVNLGLFLGRFRRLQRACRAQQPPVDGPVPRRLQVARPGPGFACLLLASISDVQVRTNEKDDVRYPFECC